MVHPHKRAKIAAAQAMAPPPSPATLVKAKLDLSGNAGGQQALSPGSHFGCRIAVQTPQGSTGPSSVPVFFASGPALFHTAVPTSGAGALVRGKEGVCIPSVHDKPVPTSQLGFVQHLAEVQSVTLAEREDGSLLLGSIDSLGRASISSLDSKETSRVDSGEPLRPLHSYQLSPPSVIREPGWAGIAVSAQQHDLAATTSYFGRSVVIYEGEIPIRTIGLPGSPTSLRFLPTDFPGCSSGAVVAVSQGHQVDIWDARASGQGALVAQLSLCSGVEPLFCVQARGGDRPVLGAAGADRSLGIWEPRRWTFVSRWNNCLKYEVHHLEFSTINREYCYVAGADYEVLCGTWWKDQRKGGGSRTGKGTGHVGEASDMDASAEAWQPMAFRGDARWLGLSRAQGADVLAGLSSSGHVFVSTMNPASALAGV